jgi:hypothetical protein
MCIALILIAAAVKCRAAPAGDASAKEVLTQEYSWPAVPPGGKNQEVRHEFVAQSDGAFETVVKTLSGSAPYYRIEWKGAGRSKWSRLGQMRPRFFVDAGDTIAVHILQVGSETRFRVTVVFHPKEESAPAAWFSSSNFQASGTESHRVREHLLQLQQYFTLIDEQIRARNFTYRKINSWRGAVLPAGGVRFAPPEAGEGRGKLFEGEIEGEGNLDGNLDERNHGSQVVEEEQRKGFWAV